jgi:hypothetical protein
MTFKPPKEFTSTKLLILFAIAGIGATLGVTFSIANGDSIIPNKQQCLNAGGKWSEGIQYGRMTQLCTYN